MPKWLTYSLRILGVLVVLLYLFMRFFLDMRRDEEEARAYLEGLRWEPSFHTYQVDGRDLFYTRIGADSLPAILFIHGSPGSWDAWIRYFRDSLLLDRFQLISVDRIGYGRSSPGIAEPSLRKQAAYLLPVLEQLPDSLPVVVVGHSYGGPVAQRFAMDYPEQVDALVLLASLTDPALEHRPAVLGWLRGPLLRRLLPPDLDVSNREIFPLRGELEAMLPDWEKIHCPVWIVQGETDILVEQENAFFADSMLVNAPTELIWLPKVDHFIPWTHYELIRNTLLEAGKRLKRE